MLSSHIADGSKMQETPLVLFTGGGTAGHVYPGLAVLDQITSRVDVRVAWIGGTSGMERRLVRRAGVPFVGIPTGKLRRYRSIRNVGDVFRVAAGVLRSISIVARMRPAVVFSKGGFVSVPPVIAAWLCRVPVISHESDADPGLATRINARFSARVLVPYESVAACFPRSIRSRVRVSGNPIRIAVTAGDRARGLTVAGFDHHDPRPVVLFLGGSLGARQINELVTALAPGVRGRWRIVHQYGGHEFVAPADDGSYFGRPFFHDELPDLLAAADVLVCRAGASTLWEGAALALPMLLVPLDAGSRGDQLRNAAVFERAGGARVFTRADTLAADVADALVELGADPERRRSMGEQARAVVRTDAARLISGVILEILSTRGQYRCRSQE